MTVEREAQAIRRVERGRTRASAGRWLVVAAVALLGLGLWTRIQSRGEAEPTSVQVGVPVEIRPVEVRAVTETIDAGGSVEASEEVAVAPMIAGRVAAVLAHEGDRVRAGQSLVRLESDELMTQVQQSEANVAAARARLEILEEGARPQERAQAEAQVRQAEAGLKAAQVRLQMLEQGARPQERAQADAAVAQARANYEAAQADLKRMQALYQTGAISKAQLDAAQLQQDVARAQYDAALLQQNLVQTGPRLEEIEMTRNQVRVAQAQLDIARQQLALVQQGPRLREIEMARAQMAQARAAVAFARLQLATATITSPLSGLVTRRSVNPGDIASPGRPVITVARIDRVDVVLDVTETDAGRVKVGQPATINVDAYRDRTFSGTVREVGQAADPRSRTFQVKVTVANPDYLLRPGMFARGEIFTARREGALVIPRDAVLSENGRTTVFVVEGGKAAMRVVRLGMMSGPVIEILSGLARGDAVIVAGQSGLVDGTPVAVR